MNIVQPLKKTIMLLEKFNCIIMFKNKAYIGISFVILIFGIYAVPKIVARIKNDKVVQGERLDRVNPKTEVYTKLIKIGPAPKFELINQNNEKTTNETYKGKVYVPPALLQPARDQRSHQGTNIDAHVEDGEPGVATLIPLVIEGADQGRRVGLEPTRANGDQDEADGQPGDVREHCQRNVTEHDHDRGVEQHPLRAQQAVGKPGTQDG